MSGTRESVPWHRLPVMWLVVVLPLLAILAGLALVAMAGLHPDPEMRSERITTPSEVPAAPRPARGD